MAALLEITDLTLALKLGAQTVPALVGIDYRISEGQTVGLVGESGCGKSLTSLAIMGLLPENAHIAQGSIAFRGQRLDSLSESAKCKLRGAKMAMIFQEPMTALNPLMRIEKQITESIMVHQPEKRAQAHDRARYLLDRVGIHHTRQVLRQYPHELSGGMRQRVMIAMSLACAPDLLIADEPTTALDVTTQAEVLDLLMMLVAEDGLAIQFITHDLAVISEVADDTIVMYAGTIVERGPTAYLLASPMHPYTKGLIASIPTASKSSHRLSPIDGVVPPLSDLPEGCRFQSRCPARMKKCRRAPPLQTIGDQRQVACHLYDGSNP